MKPKSQSMSSSLVSLQLVGVSCLAMMWESQVHHPHPLIPYKLYDKYIMLTYMNINIHTLTNTINTNIHSVSVYMY